MIFQSLTFTRSLGKVLKTKGEVLKTKALGFQHFPRDLANVNWITKSCLITIRYCKNLTKSQQKQRKGSSSYNFVTFSYICINMLDLGRGHTDNHQHPKT